MQAIPSFLRGQRWADPQTRRGLNELVAVANRRRTMRGDGLIRVSESAAGTTIGLNLGQLLPRIPKAQTPRVGIIKSTGPASEADGSNEWYWVEPTYLPATTAGSNTARALSGQTTRFRAIHIDEEAAHTHTLATDGTIRVEFWWEEDASGKRWPYFRRAVTDPWIATTLVKTSTGSPSYDADADLGIEYDGDGAMTAETRAFFRFPAAVSNAQVGHLLVGGASLQAAPWQHYFRDEDFDAGNTYECSWNIHAAFVTAAIADTISWGSEPASGNETVIAEIKNLYEPSWASNISFTHHAGGVNAFELGFLDAVAPGSSTIYGVRLRVTADITHSDIVGAWFAHDQSESSDSLALWYREPIA